MIHVISTASPSIDRTVRQRCIDSVRRQVGADVYHTYIDSAPDRCMLQNLVEAVDHLAPDAVVLSVDGDDILAHDRVAQRVAALHAEGYWCTYGSFVYSDGRPGFAAPCVSPYRSKPWTCTHLKTFRAGLLQQVKRADLMWQGAWRDRGQDPAWFWPCLEMAAERVLFCREVLYVYNLATSFEHNATQAELMREHEMVAHARSLKPYERIEKL